MLSIIALWLAQGASVVEHYPARDLWVDCLVEQRDRLRSSDEAIELVVTAMMAACRSEETRARDEFRDALAQAIDYVEASRRADAEMVEFKQTMRDSLTGYMVEYRLQD